MRRRATSCSSQREVGSRRRWPWGRRPATSCLGQRERALMRSEGRWPATSCSHQGHRASMGRAAACDEGERGPRMPPCAEGEQGARKPSCAPSAHRPSSAGGSGSCAPAFGSSACRARRVCCGETRQKGSTLALSKACRAKGESVSTHSSSASSSGLRLRGGWAATFSSLSALRLAEDEVDAAAAARFVEEDVEEEEGQQGA